MKASNNSDQPKQKLVVVGGGFGGIELIKRLRNSDFEITLVDKHNYHTFQPLLYQVASGGLSADSIGYPFRLIFRNQKNFRFRMAEVQKVDSSKKQLETSTGIIPYDHLVLATGSTSNYFGNTEVERYGRPLKSIPEALNLRSEILQELEKATLTAKHSDQKQHMTFVIVGGGPTGVETAGALAEFKKFVLPHDYPELDPKLMRVYLVEAGPRLLNGMSEKSGNNAVKYLQNLGVEVLLNVAVLKYDGHKVVFSDQSELESTTLVWSAGVKGFIVSGLPEESVKGNRYVVDEFNRVAGTDAIYSIGDSAGMVTTEKPRGFPMVAPVAVQQGTNLAKNLLRLKDEKAWKPFQYKDKGSMATVGRNKAVVDMPNFSFGGFFAWLVWMFLHLMLLAGFRNRVIVFVDWMWSYLTYERALRLIVRRAETPK
ncbi:MAG TPA: NAD(P)/FAD-dependent oxidoreductase [Flavobacteriales bacterium]|nr:NAD(P)/FAD-dependent oxidoreductase [Flavobacteriales bacterium]HPH83188.1 NAD(P)/FAD-dependent oxidoreductase [Flavobacteriales bacterium]